MNEAQFIENAKENKIYVSATKEKANVKFITKVLDSNGEYIEQENSGFERSDRSKISFCFVKHVESNEIKNLTIKKYSKQEESSMSFDKDVSSKFTEFFLNIPFIELSNKSNFQVLDTDINKQRLAKELDTNTIQEILTNKITDKDIVSLGYRKSQLEIFNKLLTDEQFFNNYKSECKKNKDESAWQHFLMQNQWIMGYGLDYKFMSVLQKEFATSASEGDGSSVPFVDFLMGDKKFTTFVELKKPDTNIFGRSKNRANCWVLSNDLMDAVSQILEHKASGQIKLLTEQHDENGNRIIQKPYDSKTILIIGNWNQIERCNDKEKQTKEKTFELFRRNLRNIEIITYDELYDRARFIVEN